MKLTLTPGQSPLKSLRAFVDSPTPRILIKTDGTCELLAAPRPYRKMVVLIGAQATDTVALEELVMLLDDLGSFKELPINDAATALYWEKCGGPVDHFIRGDVVIVPDEDFA